MSGSGITARLHVDLRRLSLAIACCVGTAAASADSTFLHIPGVIGTSTGTGYAGWFDVTQHNIVLIPGIFGVDNKTVISQCNATIRTQLGSAGAQVGQLIGAFIGSVTLDRVSPSNASPIYRAVMRNVVLVQQSTIFEAGAAYDVLWLRFDGMDVITFEQNRDGTLGNGSQGSFNCLFVR